MRHLYGSYKRSKYVAEHEVLRAIAEGLPASLVLPTFPVGPGDRAPTPTGHLILDYLNGRVPGFVNTILNVAHVDDVAAGHVLALEQGRNGRSYILGGENLTLEQLLGELAAITGLPRARIKVPRALSLAVAAVSETIEGRLLHRHPSVPLEAARMSTSQMAFDVSRARTELGYAPRPAARGARGLRPLVRRQRHGERAPAEPHHLASPRRLRNRHKGHGPRSIAVGVCDAHAVSKGRLEAFSDAVIAIAMTIMVLNLRPPVGRRLQRPPARCSRNCWCTRSSFTFLAIYWNNHHHLMQVVEHIDGTGALGEHGTALRACR